MSADEFTELRREGRFPAATVMDQVNLQIAIYDNLRSGTALRTGAPLVAVMRAFVEELAREIGEHRHQR